MQIRNTRQMLTNNSFWLTSINVDQPLIKIDEPWWTHNVYSEGVTD